MGVVREQTRRSLNAGPASVSEVMAEWELLANSGDLVEFQPLATGFTPLDDVLNGGLRPGELTVIGGPYGVGKTILGMQIARNVVRANEHAKALYICYEHDRTHLFSRLLCLESAEPDLEPVESGLRPPAPGLRPAVSGSRPPAPGLRPAASGPSPVGPGSDQGLTLRKLATLATGPTGGSNLFQTLRSDARYAGLLRRLRRYGDRLILVRAGGSSTGLDEIEAWIEATRASETESIVVVIDYLQKIMVDRERLTHEDAVTTHLMHGLKEMALTQQIQMIAIGAADRASMQGRRMRFADLRGSSAMQYETDVGIVLNNKYDIVSREHLIYNLGDAEAMRNRVVLTVEKNRAGRHAVDMEYMLDAQHFRFVPAGSYVRERLIDGKAVLE